MTITANPEWPEPATYAAGATVVLIILFNIPYIGRVLRALFSGAILSFCLFVIFPQAPFDPNLSRLTSGLGLDRQKVVGEEVRIPLSRDWHFWAQVTINGIQRRMLVGRGTTVTAVSSKTGCPY